MSTILEKSATVAVAMSGGVDSSVVAALLKNEGYHVIGFTLQLHANESSTRKTNTCCASRDIYDAKYIASLINIPHYVLNYEKQFQKEVIDQFISSYSSGYTPIPCITCNQTVKFRDLLRMAKNLGANALATGHYVQKKQGKKSELHQGVDPLKDQSYFLFTTTNEQIDFLHFPLGNKKKEETRLLAKELGLPIAKKRDSQGICFVGNSSYVDFIRNANPDAEKPGKILHQNGSVLGNHPGIIHFTVGQRHGLGIGGRKNHSNNTEPLYVVKINPKNNEIIVGPKSALIVHRITLQEQSFNWLGDEPLDQMPQNVTIRVRSLMTPVMGTIHKNKSSIYVTLQENLYGAAPGQACVIYQGTRLLGGGWI